MGDSGGRSKRDEAAMAKAVSSALRSAVAESVAPSVAASVLRAVADSVDEHGVVPEVRVVAFSPGRRPSDEVSHPGLGSSDAAAVLVGPAGSTENEAHVLIELTGVGGESMSVVADAALADGAAVPGWSSRPVEIVSGRQRQRVTLRPEDDLADADLGFAAGYLTRLRVDVTARRDGVAVAGDSAELDVCDIRLLGSLYGRIVERLVVPDAARQAARAGVADPGAAYHPWFPVLTIGMDKAALYTKALVDDIVGKQRHLTDPGWLLRVGVYLELLTCLGIVEAVKGEPDVGDLLDPAERRAFESSPVYAEIRRRIDPAAWREVWALRHVHFPRLGVPRTGPVSSSNLLQKKRATLRFLHVHHEDLKHAIELAGPNLHNSQETWQRVFRDAERAVLRQTADAFPELAFLPGAVRNRVLWEKRGIGEQTGLYATACTQYRASMNAVASWANDERLMDFTGAECVPLGVSLLDARLHAPERVAVLQRADGYGPDLDVVDAMEAQEPTTEEIVALLAEVPILTMLDDDDLGALASAARPLLLGPTERLIVQGEEGDSLFVVGDGEVEVVVRREDGVDVAVDTMKRGAVIGEMALLTGERRAATVRAVDGAVVYEIGQQQYEPMLRAHPEWLEDLATIMEARLAARGAFLAAHDTEGRGAILARIRRRFFDSRHEAAG